MNAVLDIIIVVILISCVFIGYKNGFVKTVMNFLSFIIAFIIAKTFSSPLSEFIYSNWIKPNFVAGVTAKIEQFLSPSVNLDSLVQNPNPPNDFLNMLKGYGVDLPDVNKWINDAIANGAHNLNEYVATNLVEPVAKSISYFIAFAAVLIVALILLKIVTALINKAMKLPGLNLINSIGGLVLGFVYGVVLCYIFVFLAYYILPYLSANTSMNSVTSVINDTVFFKWIYEHPLMNLIFSQ